jgi:hypothetical protein
LEKNGFFGKTVGFQKNRSLNQENRTVLNKIDQFLGFLNQISDFEFYTDFIDIHGFH